MTFEVTCSIVEKPWIQTFLLCFTVKEGTKDLAKDFKREETDILEIGHIGAKNLRRHSPKILRVSSKESSEFWNE